LAFLGQAFAISASRLAEYELCHKGVDAFGEAAWWRIQRFSTTLTSSTPRTAEQGSE
jgi:hypothetical protein